MGVWKQNGISIHLKSPSRNNKEFQDQLQMSQMDSFEIPPSPEPESLPPRPNISTPKAWEQITCFTQSDDLSNLEIDLNLNNLNLMSFEETLTSRSASHSHSNSFEKLKNAIPCIMTENSHNNKTTSYRKKLNSSKFSIVSASDVSSSVISKTKSLILDSQKSVQTVYLSPVSSFSSDLEFGKEDCFDSIRCQNVNNNSAQLKEFKITTTTASGMVENNNNKSSSSSNYVKNVDMKKIKRKPKTQKFKKMVSCLSVFACNIKNMNFDEAEECNSTKSRFLKLKEEAVKFGQEFGQNKEYEIIKVIDTEIDK